MGLLVSVCDDHNSRLHKQLALDDAADGYVLGKQLVSGEKREVVVRNS